MRPSLLPLLCGALLLLAGCTGFSASPAQEEPAPAVAKPAAFDEETGGIQGIVTNDEIYPAVGATIRLDHDATTTVRADGDGAFSFSFVPPGKHSLIASMEGFHESTVEVTVKAAEVTVVHVLMRELGSIEPYARTTQNSGFMACAYALVRTSTAGSCPQSSGGTTRDQHTALGDRDARNYTAIVFEAEWKTQDLLLFNLVDETKQPPRYYWRARSSSPLHVVLEKCADYRTGPGAASHAMPCADAELEKPYIQAKTKYLGRFREATVPLDPVCAVPVPHPTGGNLFGGEPQGCYGVGIAVDLRWTSYNTVFYLEAPKDVASFSVLPDS